MALRQTARFINPHGNRLQTAPEVEPVTLTELKTHLRVSNDDEDAYLAQILLDAVQEIEDATGLALITQTWKLTLDRWPMSQEQWWDGVVEAHVDVIYSGARWATVTLPRYPLQSVDTVTVYDEGGSSTVVTIANVFDIDTSFLRGRMTLKQGATWPVALRSNAAIEIDYTSGYGAAPTAVPAPLKRAVRQMAAYMYQHRGDGCDPKDAYKASGADTILNRYRDARI